MPALVIFQARPRRRWLGDRGRPELEVGQPQDEFELADGAVLEPEFVA
jgi:hypothetical protein